MLPFAVIHLISKNVINVFSFKSWFFLGKYELYFALTFFLRTPFPNRVDHPKLKISPVQNSANNKLNLNCKNDHSWKCLKKSLVILLILYKNTKTKTEKIGYLPYLVFNQVSAVTANKQLNVFSKGASLLITTKITLWHLNIWCQN